MTRSERLSQNGSTTLTVLMVILVFVIGALIYVLFNQSGKQTKRVTNIENDVEQIYAPRSVTSDQTGNYDFDDGLKNPESRTTYPLDEFGEGLASTDTFNIDINADGRKDRITRSLYENGTDHFYYDYTIELNSGNSYVNITPDSFRTIEGAECALQKIRFVFRPTFQVIKISRPWEESWTTPSNSTKTIYKFSGNDLNEFSIYPMKKICNVSDLF